MYILTLSPSVVLERWNHASGNETLATQYPSTLVVQYPMGLVFERLAREANGITCTLSSVGAAVVFL